MRQHRFASTQSRDASRWLWCIVLLLTTMWLVTLNGRKLLNPDEGRYAEISREMLTTGDWITPRLNDLKYFEKPPLQYWATAAAYQNFGQTEFAARLWCGLTGLTGIFFVGWVGARLFGRAAGLMTSAMLASSLMFFALGHWNTLDMGLTFFLMLAIGAFLAAQAAPLSSTAERNYMLLAWGAAALAVLSKGIIAIALPALTLIAYTAIEREFSAWRRLHVVPGLLVFFAIGAPWFIAVSLANPEFPEFFFLHEHFARFLTDVHQRVEPWWYFLPLAIAGALPWSAIASIATIKAWRLDALAEPTSVRPRRFLVVWIAVVVVFFSASHSKLAPYILPIFPALALLSGDYIARAANNTVRNHLIAIGALWTVVLAYLVSSLVWGPMPHRNGIAAGVFVDAFLWFAVAAALAVVAAVLAWMFVRRDRIPPAIYAMSIGTFIALSILITQLDAARTFRSGYDLAQVIKPQMSAHLPLYSILTYDHSLAFYLDRNATVVNYQGELEFGQNQEPTKHLATWQEFAGVWRADHAGSVAVMRPEAYEALKQNGAPMEVIGRNLQLIAVKKP